MYAFDNEDVWKFKDSWQENKINSLKCIITSRASFTCEKDMLF